MKEMIGSQKHKNRASNDFYTTEPKGVISLLLKENISNKNILENSAGNGAIVKELLKFNNSVYSVDLLERDFKLDYIGDFLKLNNDLKFDLAVYNPPFNLFIEFVEHTFKFTDVQWVLGRIQILESVKRFENIFKKGYLEKVLVFIGRMKCYKNDIKNDRGSSMVYCWFKFNKNFKGSATIDWISLNEVKK